MLYYFDCIWSRTIAIIKFEIIIIRRTFGIFKNYRKKIVIFFDLISRIEIICGIIVGRLSGSLSLIYGIEELIA